jgi:hypothetical protein
VPNPPSYCRLAFLLAVASACTPPTEPEVTLSFHGTVTEQQSGVPLEGVRVLITAGGPFRCLFPPCSVFETETDASGAFSYATGAREQCQLLDTWRITVGKEGFFPESTEPGDIRCVSGVQRFDFRLQYRPGSPRVDPAGQDEG